MSDQAVHYILLIVGVLGSVAAYTAAHRLFAPPVDDEGDLAKLAKNEVGTTTAFSKLNPNGSLIDRLDLFLLKALNLDVKLEEMHMMMGRPDKPSPLEMLHMKEMFAALFMGVIFFVTGTPIVALFGAVGFFVPDSLFSGKIQARQKLIMRNFPTFI